MDLLGIATLVPLLAAAGTLIELIRGERRMARLGSVPPAADGPSVTVVVAARDEAAAVERGIRSMLRQRYPRLRVVAVDDRSTDGTGEILDRIAARNPRLSVLHVRRLPDGWLGKNHALHRGAELARGDLLLFTDADVTMEPDTVGRAVALLEREGLDHLAAGPHVRVPGLLAGGFVALFTLFFSFYSRPWRASDPRSRAHVGIGAFNLVRTRAYRGIGGHRSLALRPDDDMRLGRRLKEAGHRQAFAVGTDCLRVDWYGSLAGMIRGLEKNAFAGVDYRLSLVVAATVAQLFLFVWPFAALAWTGGWLLAANAATCGTLVGILAGAARRQRTPAAAAAFFPAYVLLFLFVVWRSALLVTLRGGIVWRGTFYPLDRLRSGR
jgi:cellulose synthase/poly-beta-1,6-N-acetylglucosamine synthase-like glycosyltransferase